MTQKFKNNARSLLVGSIAAGATSLTVEAGKADLFPVGTTSDWGAAADWFKVTLEDSLGNVEIVKVGTRALGSAVLGNLLRGQDGTTALAFTAGSTVGLRITAADVESALAGSFPSANVSGNATIGGDATIGGKLRHNSIDTRPIPVGGIIMYSGSIASIPAGWQLCDGTNGTPNLRDRFVMGAGSAYAVGASGGSKDSVAVAHTHAASLSGTTSANGAHSHSINDPGHAHNVQYYYGSASNPGRPSSGENAGSMTAATYAATTGISINGVGDHQHTVTTSGTTASAGESGTDKNLPPYYALAFIQCMAYA